MVPSFSRAVRSTGPAQREPAILRHWLLLQLGISGAAWAVIAAGILYIV
jgi:hypothetical protein